MHKSGYLFLSAMMLVSNIACSTKESTNLAGVMDFELSPGLPLNLSNTLSSTISANCQIHAVSGVVSTISVKVLNGSGVFNGTTLKRGQSDIENVRNMQVIPVVAYSGAQAEFVNIGAYTVRASCSY